MSKLLAGSEGTPYGWGIMNRIYQGRVTKVEMPNPDKNAPPDKVWLPFHRELKKALEFQEYVLPAVAEKNSCLQGLAKRREVIRKSEDVRLLAEINSEIAKLSEEAHELRKAVKQAREVALWDHHQTFQDAVNYYTLALVALGEGLPAEHPICLLKGRMDLAWESFPREVTGALSLGQSLRPWLGMANDGTFSDAIKVVRSQCGAQDSSRYLAVGLLCRQAEKLKPQKCANSYWGRFCAKLAKEPNWDYSNEEKGRVAQSRLWLSVAWADDAVDRLDNLAETLRLSTLVKCVPGAKALDRKGGLGLVNEAIAHLKNVLSIPPAEVDTKNSNRTNAWLREQKDDVASLIALEVKIDELTEASLMTETKRGGGIDINKPYSAILFKAFPSAFTLSYLRTAVGKPMKTKEKMVKSGNLEAEVEEVSAIWPKVEAMIHELRDDPIRRARGGNNPVFAPFTSLKPWNATGTEACWSDYDKCAFEEALKTLNQYTQKSEERDKRREVAKAELLFIKGENPDWKLKVTVEEETRDVFILAGDPRYDKLVTLLKEMDEDRAERSKDEIVGPTEAALRGFGKLRGDWMDLYRKHNGKPSETVLQDKVADLQREHKLDMGHTDFFLKLCEADNWEIWRDATPDELSRQKENRWARNVVYAAADAQELAYEVKRLEDPIRYTPAEPEHSRRLFMFTDIQNTAHVQPGVMDVCLAAKDGDGKIAPTRVRIHYEAPRMVRDEITGGKGSRWLQPMMKALGLDPADQGKLKKDPAVALMPDWVGRKRELHFLLNFPVDIDTECVEKKIGKKGLWDKQMNTAWEDSKIKQRFHLLWDGMTTTAKQKPEIPWWKHEDVLRDGVVSLSIDMGQRRAGDYALLHSLPRKELDSFVLLGEQGGHEWHTRIWNYMSPNDPTIKVSGVGSLKLPGEDADVFVNGKRTQEPFGRKGRLSDQEDYDEAIALARRLLHSDDKAENWLGVSKDCYSVPEQNDKLVRLFLGGLSRYRTWLRWSWQLAPEHGDRWERVFKKEIGKVWYFDSWKELAEQSVTPSNAAALQRLVADEAQKLRKILEEALIKIANRVVPLRDNGWRWVNLAAGDNEKPLHQLASDGPKPDKKPKSRGQRGLSVARLEQLEDFRRSILSLNRLLRHAIGVKPEFGAGTFGTRLPDPCAVLTDKIVRMKEERVNQTAHMILALALGVQLKAPSDNREYRDEHDIHGEYEAIPGRKPVDFIVLEDLSRYTTDKSRARSENSRLMKWCHRAINEKIKMLAEPFGLPVVEVFASHTSRFDARTGGAGFRAAEVGAKDRAYWKKSIEKEQNPALAEVFAQLDSLEASGFNNARLMIPQVGGEFFIEAKPNTNAHDPGTLPKVRQADINAAVNIGLRAIAGPHCFHAHPRVRIEKVVQKEGADPTWQTRAKGNKREQVQFEKAHSVTVNLSAESKLMKDATATLMYDKNKIAKICAHFGQATIKGYQHEPLAHNAAIFSRQKNEKGEYTGAVAKLEWKICKDINEARIAAWKGKRNADDEIPM